MAEQKFIEVRGAREHNLKGVDVDIPRDQFVVITGLSGSGKSSLAFDTIYAEGQRRYVESLSAYARQFLDMMGKPDVDHISGLSPAISIEQKTTSKNPRSTVGTVTEIYDYMRLLFARAGTPYSPATGEPIEAQQVQDMVDAARGAIAARFGDGSSATICAAPAVEVAVRISASGSSSRKKRWHWAVATGIERISDTSLSGTPGLAARHRWMSSTTSRWMTSSWSNANASSVKFTMPSIEFSIGTNP